MCVCVCVCVYIYIYVYIRDAFNKFPAFFENSVCYCYISYEMTDQFFRFKSTATTATGIRKDALEERYAIKFCLKLGKNATEIYGILQTAIRPSCRNRTSVFEWHKRFKEGRESVRDDERCGRSKQVNRPELIGQRVRVRVTM